MSESGTHITGLGLALPGVAEAADLVSSGERADAPPPDPAERIGRKGLRYKDRATQLALVAARDALCDAGLITPDRERCAAGGSTAVVASSNLGNLDSVCTIAGDIAEKSVAAISPMNLPNASSNVVASSVAIRFGLRGPNLMLCNGVASGLDAVRWGASLISAGRAERALVVGVETGNGVTARLTGVPEDDQLDGAVALVLESSTAARLRGATSMASLGEGVRSTSVAGCVGSLLPYDASASGGTHARGTRSGGAVEAGPGVWFVPERFDLSAPLPGTEGLERHDVTRTFGRASGALGVLQCAAAVSWFASGEATAALVTSGDDGCDGVAGMMLGAPRGAR
ncbi:hypothetical protein DB35_25985 [Streptomyces abyssalis]|uniref:Beta-ketoacyl synthase-like N-terminal domain-containing protein n=1 Tax=Streptomyces abyssalis TaxID=933944 RepID=A0A1E7JMX7_9ACTN|nr:beta-ketoacyl synthase N-terminal-like domain-containing protein [Streptomyces abyssalis]OEU87015.1 hypothetical protein DB35_25985 [Streptomyces abyssalis]OEU89600.1 hypothetical protein AN215_07580 [Streptomyces abyssalis]OEV21081.1 hypothetical protein AN219_27265 [Streptomyces nanshensis]